MVLYFSASGNSRFAAQAAGDMLSDEVVCLNGRIKAGDCSPLHSERPWVLVCPIFAWRIPRLVEEHLRKVSMTGSRKVYLLVTTCGSSGNAGAYAGRFFEALQKEWMGWYTFHMPGSYIAFMENPDIQRAPEMNRQVVQLLKALVPQIEKGEPLEPYPVTRLGRFMSWAANPFFYRFIMGRDGFYATDGCVKCGKCSNVCPLNNITLEESGPVWGRRCTHCMACVHQCPKQAVEFRKISVGKNRYYNPGYRKER